MKKENEKSKIKKVIVVNQKGWDSFHKVGENGVTDIVIGCRMISEDVHINSIMIYCGKNLLEEISMNTPYIITYF